MADGVGRYEHEGQSGSQAVSGAANAKGLRDIGQLKWREQNFRRMNRNGFPSWSAGCHVYK